MIFCADLDGTLLFSQRRILPEPPVTAVEFRYGEPFGFMTACAYRNLREIQKRSVFFINTLRGEEQAKRVQFVGDGGCAYLSTQNGLYLYRDGVLDPVWAQKVEQTVRGLPQDLSSGIQTVLREQGGIECLSKQYEYLAVFFVDAGAFDETVYKQLQHHFAARGWEFYRQRKKLYLSPLAIDKGSVLQYVRACCGQDRAVGFGDSWFDLPMLSRCDARYSLCGCELDGIDWGFPITFSRSPAQAGTEEILSEIVQELKNVKA